MTKEDFKVGRECWNGLYKSIMLCLQSNGGIGLYEIDTDCIITTDFSNVSLTPPKQKKRFWQWKIKMLTGEWFRLSYYVDDEEGVQNECSEFI